MGKQLLLHLFIFLRYCLFIHYSIPKYIRQIFLEQVPKCSKHNNSHISQVSSLECDNFGVCLKVKKMMMILGNCWEVQPMKISSENIMCIFTQFLHHRQSVTQCQFLNGVQVVWIQNFPSPKLVVHYLPIAEERTDGLMPFPKWNSNSFINSISNNSNYYTKLASIKYNARSSTSTVKTCIEVNPSVLKMLNQNQLEKRRLWWCNG